MIGMIVKTNQQIDDLTEDWMPDGIDIQKLVGAFINVLGYSPTTEEFYHDQDDSLIYFTIDDLKNPRAITFSCSSGGAEAALINSLAADLDAKIYDIESNDFVRL